MTYYAITLYRLILTVLTGRKSLSMIIGYIYSPLDKEGVQRTTSTFHNKGRSSAKGPWQNEWQQTTFPKSKEGVTFLEKVKKKLGENLHQHSIWKFATAETYRFHCAGNTRAINSFVYGTIYELPALNDQVGIQLY